MRFTRWTLALIVATFLVAGLWPTAASATSSLGPFCFSNAPFDDVLVFFFDGTPFGNQYQGTGRELNTSRAATVTAYTAGTSVVIGYHVLPTRTAPRDQIGGATINLATLTGPGFCMRTNSASGCGIGTDITLSSIPCPVGATSSPESSANPG